MRREVLHVVGDLLDLVREGSEAIGLVVLDAASRLVEVLPRRVSGPHRAGPIRVHAPFAHSVADPHLRLVSGAARTDW